MLNKQEEKRAQAPSEVSGGDALGLLPPQAWRFARLQIIVPSDR